MKRKETRGTFVSESKNKWRKKRKGRKQNSTTGKDDYFTYYCRRSSATAQTWRPTCPPSIWAAALKRRKKN